MSDEELLLSSRLPGRSQKRTAVAFALLLLVVFLVVLPFRNYPLGRHYPFLSVMFTGLVLADALTATLLFSQAAVVRSRSLMALATGYLFSALILIVVSLTYAHAFSDNGLLSAGLSTSTWLYFFWHTGFPVAVIVYAALKATDATHSIEHDRVRPTIILCMAGSAVLVALLAVVAITGESWLPQLMTDASTFSRVSLLLTLVPVALFVGALLAVLVRGPSTLDLWLTLALWSWLFESVLTMNVTGRFTLGWYIANCAGMLAGVLVLALLLSESNRLHARLALLVTSQRREREGRLLTTNAVAAAMAHEIKQPLATIMFNALAGRAIVQHAPPDINEVSELFKLIEQDAQRTAKVVDSIRAMFTHRGSEKVRVDINGLIRETASLVGAELLASRVRLDLTLDEQIPLVPVDRVQMKHVFLNLVTNAIEAMTTVTDRPRMLAIRSTATDAEVQVTVEDSGSGIDPDHSGRIFEPFFTTKPQGTGMGLSLSRSIIEAHGGRIWVTTDQPFGAAFHVQLPRPGP